MSNSYVDDDEQSEQSPVRAHIKKIEAQNKELVARVAKAENAERRLVFVEAGVNTSTLAAQDFVKAYDGELTTEAIREAAIARQLIADADPELEAEQAAQQRITKARTAGEKDVVVLDLAAQIKAAKSPAELEALMARANAGKSI